MGICLQCTLTLDLCLIHCIYLLQYSTTLQHCLVQYCTRGR